MNFNFAKNFKHNTPTTPRGASTFFSFSQVVGPGGRPQVEDEGAGGAGRGSSVAIEKEFCMPARAVSTYKTAQARWCC